MYLGEAVTVCFSAITQHSLKESENNHGNLICNPQSGRYSNSGHSSPTPFPSRVSVRSFRATPITSSATVLKVMEECYCILQTISSKALFFFLVTFKSTKSCITNSIYEAGSTRVSCEAAPCSFHEPVMSL